MDKEGIYISKDAEEFIKFILRLEEEYDERDSKH